MGIEYLVPEYVCNLHITIKEFTYDDTCEDCLSGEWHNHKFERRREYDSCDCRFSSNL